MNQERDKAQIKCFHLIDLLGYGRKSRDVIICQNCHRPVFGAAGGTAKSDDIHYGPITSKKTPRKITKVSGKGIPDYQAFFNGQGVMIEVKADGDRFAWNKIEAHQWRWWGWFERKTKCLVWVYILMGTGRAGDAKADYPLTTFLVRPHTLAMARRECITIGKVLNLPLNRLAADTRKLTAEHNITAERLLGEYKLQWVGNDLFWPTPTHPIWGIYELNPTLNNYRPNNQ